MNIVVGSTSPHKLDAVRLACGRLEMAATIRGVRAVSTVPEQPFGLDQILYGARTRSLVDDAADLVVGIESGIVSAGFTYLDIAGVVMRRCGIIVGTALSPGVVFPNEFVQEAMRTLPRRTIGQVMAETVGSDPSDGAAFVTGNRYSRVEQLSAGVIAAFAQARIP